ncbi:MAG: molecular chaperone TorD family protein [Candidatus Promineifilaceae bacterium]|nr:molecular chaperone TorD family protein [Candidatus Promineifilaceae bacterium]
MQEQSADLYLALAEALAEPPPWLEQPGQRWPLYACTEKLAGVSTAAAHAAAAFAQVRSESMQERRARHRALFQSNGRPRFWLHESLYRSGRLLGPEMLEVEQLYRAAGLELSGKELPDHASVELAFLAHLARRGVENPKRAGQWRQMEKLFLKKHAGHWLPTMGRAIAASGDAVYAPIGTLLADWLEELLQPAARKRVLQRVPSVDQPACTLCGFCSQVCPVRALLIDENDSETILLLSPTRCYGCGKCVRACETSAMTMSPSHEEQATMGPDEWQILRSSPRANCPACGEPTVSRAELEYVSRQLGHPRWLEYCWRCRAN